MIRRSFQRGDAGPSAAEFGSTKQNSTLVACAANTATVTPPGTGCTPKGGTGELARVVGVVGMVTILTGIAVSFDRNGV